MSDFPRRPALERGSLLVYKQQTDAQPDHTIPFQYNPEQLRRQFQQRTPPTAPSQRGPAREEVLRVPGPPVESITLSVVLDAADKVGDATGGPGEHGLHPVLAQLELLLYPSTADVQRVEQQAQRGRVQVQPGDVPLVMFAWGRSRVVPVSLTSMSVNEDSFDPLLNPIVARVELGLKVLTYVEFPSAGRGREAYISYQKRKEELAGGARR